MVSSNSAEAARGGAVGLLKHGTGAGQDGLPGRPASSRLTRCLSFPSSKLGAVTVLSAHCCQRGAWKAPTTVRHKSSTNGRWYFFKAPLTLQIKMKEKDVSRGSMTNAYETKLQVGRLLIPAWKCAPNPRQCLVTTGAPCEVALLVVKPPLPESPPCFLRCVVPDASVAVYLHGIFLLF